MTIAVAKQAEKKRLHPESALLPQPLSRLNFASGEHIFHEGDRQKAVYHVLEGFVILYKTSLDGTRQLLGIRVDGDHLAISGQDDHYCSAVAARFTRVEAIPRSAVEAAADASPDLAKRLLAACRKELMHTREQLLIVGTRSALGRVAALLLDIADRTAGGASSFLLPLTRSEMGDYLGLTLETVSRAMSRLKHLDVIGLKRTDIVTIYDRQRLKELAAGLGEGASRGRTAAEARLRAEEAAMTELSGARER